MIQQAIRKLLFLLVGLISGCILFVKCPSACHRSNNPPAIQFRKPTKNKDTKKDLLRVRQILSRGGVSYVEITIQPPTTGTTLSQYTLTAKVLVGEGILLAAKEKAKQKLQYTIRLAEETRLDKIYLSKGNAEVLQQGKPIVIRCMYEPEVGTQQGENHQVQIRVCAYDNSHQILEHKTEEVSFLINQVPQPKKPKATDPAKKSLSPTTKKSSQPKGIGQISSPNN
jgi:hypothetical protein